MLAQYAHIFLFTILAVLFGVVGGLVSSLVRAKSNDERQKIAYECGMEPVGSPYVPTDIRFYLFALLFLVFDVEALFLFPWAVVFKDFGLPGFIEMTVFIGVLALGLLYTWRRGGLEWKN